MCFGAPMQILHHVSHYCYKQLQITMFWAARNSCQRKKILKNHLKQQTEQQTVYTPPEEKWPRKSQLNFVAIPEVLRY